MLGMRAMMVKEFRELVRDRRTLAMLIVMPLLLLVIFGYAANFYVSSVKTAVVGPQASQAVTTLPSFFDVTVTEPGGTRVWREVDSLADSTPADRVFVVHRDVVGRVQILFGDSVNGMKPPAGPAVSIFATYRVLVGPISNLSAGTRFII